MSEGQLRYNRGAVLRYITGQEVGETDCEERKAIALWVPITGALLDAEFLPFISFPLSM